MCGNNVCVCVAVCMCVRASALCQLRRENYKTHKPHEILLFIENLVSHKTYPCYKF